MPVSVHSTLCVKITGDVCACICSITEPKEGRSALKQVNTVLKLVEVLLYIDRNRRLIKDGSLGRPLRLWFKQKFIPDKLKIQRIIVCSSTSF